MEKASLQTKVRGVSERVKLLEDILVAYVKAHGDLIKYLEASRNRSQLLSAVKNGKGREILKSAFREVDRASARHRAMLKRMHAINDEEMGASQEEMEHVHRTEELFVPVQSAFTADQQAALKKTVERFKDGVCPSAARDLNAETDAAHPVREEFEIPKEGTVLVGVEDKRPYLGKKDLISTKKDLISAENGVDGT